MLVSSQFPCHTGMCQTKQAHWGSHHQTPWSFLQIDVSSTSRYRFYPQTLLTWKPLRIRSHMAVWRNHFCLKRNWKQQAVFRFCFCQPSAFHKTSFLRSCPQDSEASHNIKTHDLHSCKVQVLQRISSDHTGVVCSLLHKCIALLYLWANNF